MIEIFFEIKREERERSFNFFVGKNYFEIRIVVKRKFQNHWTFL